MSVNNTCISGNSTYACPGRNSSSVGLAVGLTFFFLLLIVAAVIVYKYHSTIRNMLQFGHRESQVKEDCIETPQNNPHVYTSMIREQSVGQTPIYENLSTQTGYKGPKVSQSRSPGEPEEDLYLQCDLTDDAIYGNDPVCNLTVHQDSQEDVYIVPDS
eukprot:superscaffoldBa00000318_g3755